MAANTSRVCLQFVLKTSKMYSYLLCRNISSVNLLSSRYIVFNRHYSKETLSINELEQNEFVEEEHEDRENEIETKRNKSRLSANHYNILKGRKPYDEPLTWFHHTVKYKKRMFGKYGMDAIDDMPLGALWPTRSELEEKLEYENVARPDSIQTMMAKIAEKKQAIELMERERQEDVVKKYAKLEQWKREHFAKLEKKAKEAELVKQKKERLLEEVRRHFGYKVDPRDDKFKEMVEQKEKEEKKKEKDARKKAKQDKMLQKLLEKSAEASQTEEKHSPSS